MASQIHQVKIKVDSNPGEISGDYLIPQEMKAFILLAHGAGAGMNHPFMVELAKALSDFNIGSLRYNLPYMEAGKKFPGSPKPSIEGIQSALWHVKAFISNDIPIFLAGKSYGGRMSSHVSQNLKKGDIQGLIYFGFPLHAPGKPDTKRAEHLKDINFPMLFLQGSNDKLAEPKLVNEVTDSLKNTKVIYFEHADHSFKRAKKISKESLIPQLAKETSTWIDTV